MNVSNDDIEPRTVEEITEWWAKIDEAASKAPEVRAADGVIQASVRAALHIRQERDNLQQQLAEADTKIHGLVELHATRQAENTRLKDELLNFAVNTGGTIGDLEQQRDQLQAEVERLKARIALGNPISRLGVKHGDMTLGEVAALNEQLEQQLADQRAAMQGLVGALEQARIAMESAWHELKPGQAKIGDQFIRQEDMAKVILEANAALAAAKPYLEGK